MPALPDVPEVVRFTLKQTLSLDTDCINRFFVSYSGTPPTDTGMDTWTSAVATSWATNLEPLAGEGVILTEVLGEDLTSDTSAVGQTFTSDTGTRGAVIAAGVAAVLQLHIARRYRGGHPRLYLPFGIPSDMEFAQSWTSAFQTAVKDGWVAFMLDVISGAPSGTTALQQVNVSYFHGFTNVTFPSGRVRPVPTRRGTPLVDTITGVQLNPKLGSQRRRNQQSA